MPRSAPASTRRLALAAAAAMTPSACAALYADHHIGFRIVSLD